MSYTEKESEEETQKDNFYTELNSDTSLRVLPAHGYTSGFTDDLQGNKHVRKQSKRS